MLKFVTLLLLIATIKSETIDVLHNVVEGLKYVDSKFQFPNESELIKIANELDRGKSNYNINQIDVICLSVAESYFNINAKSAKNANGIMQLIKDTKRYLINLLHETNENTPSQDVRFAIYLLNEMKIVLSRTNKNPTFENLIWAYNTGAKTVINNGWMINHNVYIQPKLLARSVFYYRENYKLGIYDISSDYPGWRFSLNQEDEKVKFRINPKFKTIKIDTEKMEIIANGQTNKVAIGRILNGKTCTPKGDFRIIWKTWYANHEGGPFGSCALRINYRFNNKASVYLHGNPKPEMIGTHSTGGCVSMLNEVIEEIYKNYDIGDFVIIR